MSFKKMMRKSFIKASWVALFACAGLCIFTTSLMAADEILIGINQDITGIMAAEGRTHTDSAMMAIDEWNAKGGVNGKKIKAIFMNNGADPVRATANAKSLVRDGVAAVVGCSNSTVCIAELKEFARADIPVTGGAASTRIFEEKGSNGKPFYFSGVGADPILARGYLDAAASGGYKRIAILHLNVAWPKDITAIQKEWVQKYYSAKYGMTVVGTVEADVNATDLSLQVNQLKALNPDVIVANIYQANCLALTRAFANANWNPPWVTGWSQLDAVYAKSSEKKAFYNLIGVGYWDGNRPDTVKKHEAYIKKYGYTPTAHWATTYTMTDLLLQAIKEVGTDGKKIQSWLATKAFGKPMIAGKKGSTVKIRELNETWLSKPTTYYSLFDGTDYGRVWVDQKGNLDWKKLSK